MTVDIRVMSAAETNARIIQKDHSPDEDGNCGFCLRHFGDRYQAGLCAPWRRAQAFIDTLTSAQEQNTRRPPRRREAPRTGSG